MSHDDNEPQYYTLFLMLCGGVMDVGDIEGNEKLAEARALGAGI